MADYKVPSTNRRSGRIGASLPTYAFNDTFDRESLDKNVHWGLNRLYTRALDAQRKLCHMFRYNGSMADFKRNASLNNAFDLPYNTYSIQFNTNTINFFSTKEAKRLNSRVRNNQQEIWRCGKITTNIMSDGSDVNPMHTPDYRYDNDTNYITRDLCTQGGKRYKIDKDRYPYLYSIQETYSRPDVFTHHFIMFIDGYIYADAKFFLDNGHLYIFICTNSPSNSEYESELINENIVKGWIKDGVPFTILGFPFSTSKAFDGDATNSKFYNSVGISFDEFDEDLTPNMQYKNNLWLVGYTKVGLAKHFLVPNIMGLVNINGTTYMKNATDSEMVEKVKQLRDGYFEAFNLSNASGMTNLGDGREFQIPLNGNPIPPSNILLFRFDENGNLRLLHNAIITLYYPNVYSITNVDSDVKIFAVWFYNYKDSKERTEADNPLKEYMQYNTSYAFDLLRNNLPDYIKSYIPATVTYDYDDYSIYKLSSKSNPEDYKIGKLTEILKDNPSRYEYIYSTLMEHTGLKLHANPKQVISLADIPDFNIEALSRMDNSIACSPYSTVVEFPIPHLAFSIEHSENCNYRYAVWIDGVEYQLEYIYDNLFTTWFFLPAEVLTPTSTIEVEMMRVRDAGRICAEVDFKGLDTSIEIPKVFQDVSPQSLMISLRHEISTVSEETELNKSYYKHLSDAAVVAQDDFGVKYFYMVAPDYEMSWLLIGYNQYEDGVRVINEEPEMHKNVLIEYPYFDEDGKPKVKYLEREKCVHTSLDDTYGNVKELDWTVGSTIMSEIEDEVINPDSSKSDAIVLPLVTAINREYVQTAEVDGKQPYVITTFESPWPNGFYALERRRFYQYLPYGEGAKTLYMTPIGKPGDKDTVEAITEYLHDDGSEDITGYKTELKEFFVNPRYPKSYFEDMHAIIQNTDFYTKYHKKMDFLKEASITLDNFFDDPSINKFRVTMSGRRLDYGTDYLTDVNVTEGFLRGSPIVMTFDMESPTVKRAICETYKHADRIEGAYYASMNLFYALIDITENGTKVFSDTPVTPSTQKIYVDVANGDREYVWDGEYFIIWTDDNWIDTGHTFVDVYVEYLPYKDHIVWKSNRLTSRDIFITDSILKRPLSLTYFDMYLNGVKLTYKDITIVSPQRLTINENVLIANSRLTIYERCHDPDLYGNNGGLPKSLNDIIASKDKKFKKFLYENA